MSDHYARPRKRKGCDLYKNGTRTRIWRRASQNPADVAGETPGDREERLGRPFVGPAGQLLDQVLEELNLTREQIYLTNAVKHFDSNSKAHDDCIRSPPGEKFGPAVRGLKPKLRRFNRRSLFVRRDRRTDTFRFDVSHYLPARSVARRPVGRLHHGHLPSLCDTSCSEKKRE